MYKNHFILLLLVTLGPIGIDLHLPALIDLQNYFAIDTNAVQLSILAFVFATGIGQLLFGIISNRMAKRSIGFISCAMFIVSSVCISLTSNYDFLLAMRVIQGLGASGLSVIAYATVNENFSGDEAAIIFSIQGGFLNTIPAFAPLIGAMILALGSWRLIFAFFILYGLFTLVLFYKTFNYQETHLDNPNKTNGLRIMGRLISDKDFVLYALICTYGLGFILSYVSLAPIIMMDVFNTTAFAFSLAFGLNAGVICLIFFSLKKVIPMLGTNTCITVGLSAMTLAGLGLILFSDALTIALFWLCIITGSIGFAIAFGPAMSIALAKHTEYSGIASGFLGFMYLSLSAMVGFAITSVESNGTYTFGVCVLGAGLVLCITEYLVGSRKRTA